MTRIRGYLDFRNSCSFIVSRRRFRIELLSKGFLVFYTCTYVQSLQKDSYAVVFIIALIYRLIESKYIEFRAIAVFSYFRTTRKFNTTNTKRETR